MSSEALRDLREELREQAQREGNHVATHLFAEFDVLRDTLVETFERDERIKELLRDHLAGEVDLDEHSYITCTDEFDVNASRGCSRCIVQEFLRS